MKVYLLILPATLLGPAAAAQPSLARAGALLTQGDFPAAERELEKILARLPERERDARALVLAKIAETRAFQGIGDGAAQSIGAALALSHAPQVRQSAVLVCLRARRHAELREHAEALLELAPQDASLRFARGLALAKSGELEQASADLAAAAAAVGVARDARFELALCLAKLGKPRQALEPLLENLADDPYDAESCYQASRQLVAVGGEENARLASLIVAYFEALRAAQGPSSRAEHLAFQGKAAAAALERAGRWERLGAIEKAVHEASAARDLAGGEEAAAWLDGLVGRLGFTLPLDAVRLEAEVASAEKAGDAPRAQRAAKLLLSVAPASVPALRRLESDARVPSLVVPRWHYLRRLAAAAPRDAVVQAELVKLRAWLGGSAPPR